MLQGPQRPQSTGARWACVRTQLPSCGEQSLTGHNHTHPLLGLGSGHAVATLQKQSGHFTETGLQGPGCSLSSPPQKSCQAPGCQKGAQLLQVVPVGVASTCRQGEWGQKAAHVTSRGLCPAAYGLPESCGGLLSGIGPMGRGTCGRSQGGLAWLAAAGPSLPEVSSLTQCVEPVFRGCRHLEVGATRAS